MKETIGQQDSGSDFWRRWMMPWGLSALFHGAAVLVLAFLVFLPESADPGRGRPSAYAPDQHPRSVTPEPMRTIMAPQEINGDEGSADDMTGLESLLPDGPAAGAESAGSGGEETLWQELERGAASGAEFTMDDIAETGEETSFFGADSRARDVVYVIDHSVSMQGSFEAVRREMLRSIGRLSEEQRFHIILFSEGSPQEMREKRLVRATHENKSEAGRFLASVRPFGRTQPVEAISRAFSVLRGSGEARLIYLLTDGEFPDPARVMEAIESHTARGGVRINTYQYGDDEPAAGTLRRIAEESGGEYIRIRN